MARFKNPPRGYFGNEYPLVHDFRYEFALNMEATTMDSTLLPILRGSTENTTNPELIEVNPMNSLFAENNGPLCHQGSIIPRISIKISAFVSQAAAADIGGISKPIMFNWMPVYTAFENQIDAHDELTGLDVGDILELTKDVNFDAIHPTYSSTDLPNTALAAASFPITTTPANITPETFDDYGLGTDLIMESVSFDPELYFDAIRFGAQGSMLRKVAPDYKVAMVSGERPFRFFSNNFTHPSVKRINPFTFCGIMFHLPQADDSRQLVIASECTNIEHVFFKVLVHYDEWNNAFNQQMNG